MLDFSGGGLQWPPFLWEVAGGGRHPVKQRVGSPSQVQLKKGDEQQIEQASRRLNIGSVDEVDGSGASTTTR